MLIEERVARMEKAVEQVVAITQSHERKLEAQLEKNDTLTRLLVLYEQQEKNNVEREKRQEERDKKQQEQLDKFGDAMEKVVVTLSTISQTQQQHGERVAEIEKTLQGQKIDPIKMLIGIVLFIATGIGGFFISEFTDLFKHK